MSNWQSLLERSYVPYSGKSAAAICVGKSGTGYPGVRIENVSFPLTIDEIQAAIYHCISEGDEPQKILMSNSHSNNALEAYWSREYSVSFESVDEFDISLNQATSFSENETTVDTQIDSQLQELSKLAQVAYSDFPVSALLTVPESNTFVTGVNIETSDWRLGLCAERVAISKALSLGFSEFSSIHIYTPKADYSSPCGACRQVINEHLSQANAVMHQCDGQVTRLPANHYLPYAFRASSLIKH